MKLILLYPILLIAMMIPASAAKKLQLEMDRASLNLNGSWSIYVDDKGECSPATFKSPETDPQWTEIQAPSSSLLPERSDVDKASSKDERELVKCVWVFRTFTLNAQEARSDVVLRWGGIRFGAAAWINGEMVCDHAPIGPNTVMLPSHLVKEGENKILLRVFGFGGIAKSESGFPLTPTGSATQSWGSKTPAIHQDIWLEFYQRTYIKWALSISDVQNSKVTFRIWLDSNKNLPTEVIVKAKVNSNSNQNIVFMEGAKLQLKKTPIEITVPIENIQTWSPEHPQLYQAEITINDDIGPCDQLKFQFGMRDLTLENGHFKLNQNPLWLRGSSLVNEWLWGGDYSEKVKEYIVDETQKMNFNCLRTHTQPPPPEWLNVADQYGTMILAESPLLVNHGDFEFSRQEYEIFHHNAMIDQINWMTRMWNHPAIVMWVISNESHLDARWEIDNLYKKVKELDPTRFVMRTGDNDVGSPDILDQHTCFHMIIGSEGSLNEVAIAAGKSKDPNRALSNSEYMNLIGNPSQKLTGKTKDDQWPLTFAEIAMEHTEVMRQQQYDCILPYMFANWTRLNKRNNWKEEFPTPAAAAFYSAMSPVLASIDLFDRNFTTDQQLEIKLKLMNETSSEVTKKLHLYVTTQNPLFMADQKALDAALSHTERDIQFEPYSFRSQSFHVQTPKNEGTYYLAAVLTQAGKQPIISQRTIRAIDPQGCYTSLKDKKIAVLGGEPIIWDWLKKNGSKLVFATSEGELDADVVLIWDINRFTDMQRAMEKCLMRFAKNGSRIVILDQDNWTKGNLVDIHIQKPSLKSGDWATGSRAFPYENTKHPAFDDIPKDFLLRWNGLPGTICDTFIDPSSPMMGELEKLFWVSSPKYTAVARLPYGNGEFIFCQLKIRERIGAIANSDPVAEKILANLLSKYNTF